MRSVLIFYFDSSLKKPNSSLFGGLEIPIHINNIERNSKSENIILFKRFQQYSKTTYKTDSL